MLPHKIYNQQILKLKAKILKYFLYQGTLEEILVPRVPVDGGRKPHIVPIFTKEGSQAIHRVPTQYVWKSVPYQREAGKAYVTDGI